MEANYNPTAFLFIGYGLDTQSSQHLKTLLRCTLMLWWQRQCKRPCRTGFQNAQNREQALSLHKNQEQPRALTLVSTSLRRGVCMSAWLVHQGHVPGVNAVFPFPHCSLPLAEAQTRVLSFQKALLGELFFAFKTLVLWEAHRCLKDKMSHNFQKFPMPLKELGARSCTFLSKEPALLSPTDNPSLHVHT